MEESKNNPPHGPDVTPGSVSGAKDPCCVYEAALEVLSAPVGVVDENHLLYANAEMRQLLGFEAPEEAEGYPIRELVEPSQWDALAERRRVVLQNRVPIRDSPVKLITRSGYGLNIVTDTEPMCYGGDCRAMVQLFRSINGVRTLSYSAAISPPTAQGHTPEAACLHAGAFEALPMPAAILGDGHLVAVNRQCRLFDGDSWSGQGLRLDKMLHEDFLEPGEQLLRLALQNLHATHGIRAKLNSSGGRPAYATVDSIPVQYGGVRYAAFFVFAVSGASQ